MSNPLFTTIPLPKVSRNTFKLSHNRKFSMTSQKLYPTLLMEGLPGDRNLVFTECMIRAQPLVAPVFQSYSISHHAFFVPMRTLSKNWENFITGGKDGTYSSVLPYTTYGAIYYKLLNIKGAYAGTVQWSTVSDDYKEELKACCDVCRMLDFAGLSFAYQSTAGTRAENMTASALLSTWECFAFMNDWLTRNTAYRSCDVPVNLLPFVAMLKIWDEYYRDENIVDSQMEVIEPLGLDTAVGLVNIATATWTTERFLALFKMRPRAWKKDRFTSALPFTQRGPDVMLPIAGTAPVIPGTDYDQSTYANMQTVRGTTGLNDGPIKAGNTVLTNLGIADFENGEITTTINDFRRAERLQRWYENSARGGSRLNENTLAHWGVHTPDATLDRAVFLGGMHQPLVISEVEQNSQTATTPQGTLAGKGTSYNTGRLFKHYDSEHGYTVVFTSILQHGDYCQGTPQIFTRQDRYEYAWPEFANLGEEPIYTRELYTLDGNGNVFGYTPRYSSYKSLPNVVNGDMRTSLSSWAVPRIFDAAPQLSEDFIYNAPSKQPFAVASGEVDEFVGVIRYGIKSSRLLPFYGVPTI